ncbi:MAG: hypothetical protein K2N78_05040, partial [Oscillospiraceae bacterium]|nr:hypothetical protein [Oscillospiraceae bacterium]
MSDNRRYTRRVPPGAKKAVRLLEESWTAAEPADGPAWALAGQYHRAMTARLPSMAKGRKLSASRSMAWISEFLALEQGNGDPVPVIKNFLRAGAWLGEGADHALAKEVRRRYPAVLAAVSGRALATLQSPEEAAKMVSSPGFPARMLLQEGLGTVWSVWYVPLAIRTSLSLLVALDPKDEYPEARAMRRHFILHLGGTNTGKTYAGFQRLKSVGTGVYLAPLRLLALEAQETLLDAGVECGLATGEEEDLREEDTHIAATAEKLDLRRRWDAAVVDECQMIADPQRGYAWTRAVLGVLAPEVHLCAAPEAKDILIRLVESCGDTWEVQEHERSVPLVCMNRTVDPRRVQPGDALITFSKVGVLSVAEELRQEGKEPAIIYGALPYATRRRQMEGFLAGDMSYVVSTDAIGMGLNLPIRRVIFLETEKFDGIERRPLKPEEIKQIAGRAGRYGMYDRGYVGASQDLESIRAGLEAEVPPLEEAVAGFPELVLQADFDLLEVLTQWSQMPTVQPYRKLDVSRYIAVISRMREMGFNLAKDQELRAANIPFDEEEPALWEMFRQQLGCWQRGEPVEPPGLPEGEATLPELELSYKKLDLYFSFAKAFGCPVDLDKLYDSRERLAEDINEILLHNLRNNIRFCSRCGAALPLYHKGRLC